MIHLKANLSELTNSWLDDLVIDKKEEQREQERKKLMHAALREVANQWQVPYMTLQSKGILEVGEKKIRKSEVKIFKLENEEGGELVIGEKTVDRLEQAYSLIRLLNSSAFDKSINDWCREVIAEKITAKKAEQGNQDMEKEEKELYPAIEVKEAK